MMHDDDTEDFLTNQEIKEIEKENQLEAYKYKATLRLLDSMVVDIVYAVNKAFPKGGLILYELAYDVLHYFLISAKFGSDEVPSTYIQANWAGCHDDYIQKLNDLKTIGIFPRQGRFQPLDQGKALSSGASRILTLDKSWHEKILIAKSTVSTAPYGFQPHLKWMFDRWPRQQRKAFKSVLPRSLKERLSGKVPVESSRQPKMCSFDYQTSSHLNQIHKVPGVKKHLIRPLTPLDRNYWNQRVLFFPEWKNFDPEFRSKPMNRDLLKDYERLKRFSRYHVSRELDFEKIEQGDPDAANSQAHIYAGMQDGQATYAQINMRVKVLPWSETVKKEEGKSAESA